MSQAVSISISTLVSQYRPESHGREEGWSQHAERLWREEGTYMLDLMRFMAVAEDWVGGPVIENDGVVQDGHHRIVLALDLNWNEKEVALVHA